MPLAVLFDGRVYGDTGTYADLGGIKFRVYREDHRIDHLTAMGE